MSPTLQKFTKTTLLKMGCLNSTPWDAIQYVKKHQCKINCQEEDLKIDIFRWLS